MRNQIVGCVIALAGCGPFPAVAQPAPPRPFVAPALPVTPASFNATGPAVAPVPAFADFDVRMLASDMRRWLPVVEPGAAATHTALAMAGAMLRRTGQAIDGRQVVLVVDRSVAVQRLWVTVAYPGNRPWDVVGAVKVSTGKPGRKEHFRTPVGVFQNDGAILGYRAQGTYNENHIRGIGTKGMRVWDFGWQTTDDWRTPGALMGVRLEMHATDPDVLEPRLGRPDSEGCIRIPSRFNTFLDHTGLIDAKLTAAARTERRFAALLPKDAAPSPLAGTMVIVIDSSDPAALPSDPVRANAMEHPVDLLPGHDDAG